MVMVANDRLKRAIAQLVGEFSPVIQQRYKEMAPTTGTANGESKHRLEGIFSRTPPKLQALCPNGLNSFRQRSQRQDVWEVREKDDETTEILLDFQLSICL
jgi:hypothetical protein